MKSKILISTVLISNIVFASVLPVSTNQTNKNKKFNTFSNAISLQLYKRGLDKNIAQKKVSKFLVGKDFENDLMVQNILNNFDIVNYNNIIEHIAKSTLYSKKVDLSSYEGIIGIVQRVYTNPLDKKTLEKIEKISLENKKIKSLYSFQES